MNRSSITIRAKRKGEFTEVRLSIQHPIQSIKCDLTADSVTTESLFIQELRCFHNKQLVVTAQLGLSISENPYFAFRFKGGSLGDKIKVSWVDNQGKRDDQIAEIH